MSAVLSPPEASRRPAWAAPRRIGTRLRETRRPGSRRRPAAGVRAESLLFVGFLIFYLVIAHYLVLNQHSIMEDALSRVANARYVVESRQPKLANVGFVWTPLPSLLVLPLLPLRLLWPALVDQGLLANIVSAVAMASAVRVLCGLLTDLGVPRPVRIALGVAFGLQPLIIWFGTNGMTEALLIVLLLLAIRRLIRWTAAPDPRHLMAAGAWLALGYLTRYEILAAGAAAVVLVAGLSWWRTPPGRAGRRDAALADALLVGSPLAAAFTLWAAASWIIVGHPFEQFSSAYGNSALVSSDGIAAAFDPTLPVLQWLILAPLLPAVGVAAGVRAVRRRDLSLLAPVGLLTAIIAFEVLVYVAGSLFGFLRYQIVVIPLLAVLVGYLCRSGGAATIGITDAELDAATTPYGLPQLHPAPGRAPESRVGASGEPRVSVAATDPHGLPRLHAMWRAAAARPGRAGRGRPPVAVLTVVAAVMAMIPGILTSGYTLMNTPALASQEWTHVRPVVQTVLGRPGATVGSSNGIFEADRAIAAYLDAQQLPAGSVLVDSGPGFAILAATAELHQFVITSDLDFAGAVADPVGHHIRYLLINDGNSQYDAVAATWPGLRRGGVPPFWATRAVVFPSGGQPGAHAWTLWAVQPAP